MSVQTQINSLIQATNLESLRNALVQTLTNLNETIVSAGVASVEGGIVDNTDPANPIVLAESGNYTPTTSNEVNLNAINTRPAFYQKTGNVVMVQGYASYEPTAAGTCSFDIDLPFDTSNANNLVAQIATGEGSAYLFSTPTPNIATISFVSLGVASNVGFVISYEITE